MYWELLPFSKFAKTSFCKKCGVTPFYQMTAEVYPTGRRSGRRGGPSGKGKGKVKGKRGFV